MKSRAGFIKTLGFVIGLAILFLSGSAQAAPVTWDKTYFKVFGGDVFTGGAYASQTSCNNNSQHESGDATDPYTPASYQGPNYSGPSTTHSQDGGIIAYGFVNGGKRFGSSTDGAAFSVGNIASDGANQVAFYSGPAPNSITSLTLAMPNGSNTLGGYVEGSPQNNCIPDYYSKVNTSGAQDWDTAHPPDLTAVATAAAATPTSYSIDWNSSTHGGDPPYNLNGTFSSATIAKNAKLTIYVNGDLYIQHNITYASGYGVNTIPKFAVVVLGNIYIEQTVSRLDGVYIAQIDPSRDAKTDPTGQIWTCHDDTHNLPTNIDHNTYLSKQCRSRNINVNGALIAERVIFDRTAGKLSNATASEDASSSNPAEIIEYGPDEVIGGPFFNPPKSTTINSQDLIQSLISLPPLF